MIQKEPMTWIDLLLFFTFNVIHSFDLLFILRYNENIQMLKSLHNWSWLELKKNTLRWGIKFPKIMQQQQSEEVLMNEQSKLLNYHATSIITIYNNELPTHHAQLSSIFLGINLTYYEFGAFCPIYWIINLELWDQRILCAEHSRLFWNFRQDFYRFSA